MVIKAFRWYGGKVRMVETIKALFPDFIEYYEVFAGSGAVLLNQSRKQCMVLNDLDEELYHFWNILANRTIGQDLVQNLMKLEYSEAVFNKALEYQKCHFNDLDDVEKAMQIYILISQSFNCTRKNFSAKGYKDTNAYRRDIAFNMPKVYGRLDGVRILNVDGIELLSKIKNKPDAFAFCDPPYRKELRGIGADNAYKCEMSDSEQIRLLETIQDAHCKIMLCGYKVQTGQDLYDTYLLPHGWKCYKLAEIVKSCQTKKKKDIGQEFIWINYELPPTAKYIISMK